jgi:hypothetical protein
MQSQVRRIAIAVVIFSVLVASAYAAWTRHKFNMVAELASFAAKEGVWDNPWDKPSEKIAAVQAELKSETNPTKRLQLRRELAQRYLYANSNEAAIATLEDLLKDVERTLPPEWARPIKGDLAFAYFRLGEVQNCTWNHNTDSCIFPIRGDGVHQHQSGATEAAKLYAELLADPKTNPGFAVTYRWLLNICYMTLGQYPEQVPKQWLIRPEAFDSTYNIGRFRDVAITRGVKEFGNAGGVILEDFDNDGYLASGRIVCARMLDSARQSTLISCRSSGRERLGTGLQGADCGRRHLRDN